MTIWLLWGFAACGVADQDDPELAELALEASTRKQLALATPEDTSLVEPISATADTTITVSRPAHGTAVLAGRSLIYLPDPDYHGPDQLTITGTRGTTTGTIDVAITVTPVDDAPIALDDGFPLVQGSELVLPAAVLLANDLDVDGDPLTVTAVQNPTTGTVALDADVVRFTPDPAFSGVASFEYVVSSGGLSDVGQVLVFIQRLTVCGDFVSEFPEECDDGNLIAGDGCDPACLIEPGFSCVSSPSICTPICGDGLVLPGEACDDGNSDETDGCTSSCRTGALCNADARPGGDRFAVNADTGHCYVAFDDEQTTFIDAQAACTQHGGYLVTITSPSDDARVLDVLGPAQTPWIGASDDLDDTDAVFDWVTDEAFAFTRFAPGEPDDDAGTDGLGDCLHIANAGGEWADTHCGLVTTAIGRICEIEPRACGDAVIQPGEECDDGSGGVIGGCSATCQVELGCGNGILETGEECDDDNLLGGDGCGATCQLELGCGNGILDLGEQCDDDNQTPGDGCSATCTIEVVTAFSFPDALGTEITFPADAANPALAAVPEMSRGPGVVPSIAAGAFSASGWTPNPIRDNTDFFSFTVVPAPGAILSLTALELDERRSATGIRVWSVRSSLDNFATDIAAFTVPDDTLFRTQTIPLPAPFHSLAIPVEFRLFGFAAESTGGTWRIDNVRLRGTPAVP